MPSLFRLPAVFCAACLLLAECGLGQSVKLPAEIQGGVGAWVIVAPEAVEGGKPKWRIDPGLQEVRLDLLLPPETLQQLRGKVVTALAPGRYRVEAWNAKADEASEIATCWIVIGNPPPGPTPPGPDPAPPGPDPPGPMPPAPVQATAATYVYEKDQTGVPAQVQSALNKLNREKKIVATAIDDDVLDASGQTPEQYKSAIEVARIEGLPALVVTAGNRVLAVVKNPLTEAQVLEAVK